MAKKPPKTKKSNTKIGTGTSRSKTGGEFTIKRETVTTDDGKKRSKFLIIGAAGHPNSFNTANEVVNFCLAVYKRKIDTAALRSGALEFLDDGGVSRSEMLKLMIADGRLEKAIELIRQARATFLKGDLSPDSINMMMIDEIEGLENPILEIKQFIADTISPPVSTESGKIINDDEKTSPE